MSPSHLFVIDPLPTLNLALDSSLRMMFALAKRGHSIAIVQPWGISWASGSSPYAHCQTIGFNDSPEKPVIETATKVELNQFAAIHMRKDPPFDMEYVQATWLFDAVRPKVRVYNDPEALRSINEKAIILAYPEESRPALLSSDPEELLTFAQNQANGDAILKPLDLFGGRGVRRINLRQEDARQTLLEETSAGRRARLIQAFDSGIFSGEVRVFTAFSEPIAWCLKKPAAGNFLANTRMGASLHDYTPSAEEVARVRRVARNLLVRGVALVGFDLISGWISEVNITSPRMLTVAENEPLLYDHVARLIEDDLRKHQCSRN